MGVARHVFRPGDWVIARSSPDGKPRVAAVRGQLIRTYEVTDRPGDELGKTRRRQRHGVSRDGELH